MAASSKSVGIDSLRRFFGPPCDSPYYAAVVKTRYFSADFSRCVPGCRSSIGNVVLIDLSDTVPSFPNVVRGLFCGRTRVVEPDLSVAGEVEPVGD